MPERFFKHSLKDRRDALGYAAEQIGRPASILEKDIMVVWALGVLYGSEHGDSLSFKGGTSLSKVYRLIDRFSEDMRPKSRSGHGSFSRNSPHRANGRSL